MLLLENSLNTAPESCCWLGDIQVMSPCCWGSQGAPLPSLSSPAPLDRTCVMVSDGCFSHGVGPHPAKLSQPHFLSMLCWQQSSRRKVERQSSVSWGTRQLILSLESMQCLGHCRKKTLFFMSSAANRFGVGQNPGITWAPWRVHWVGKAYACDLYMQVMHLGYVFMAVLLMLGRLLFMGIAQGGTVWSWSWCHNSIFIHRQYYMVKGHLIYKHRSEVVAAGGASGVVNRSAANQPIPTVLHDGWIFCHSDHSRLGEVSANVMSERSNDSLGMQSKALPCPWDRKLILKTTLKEWNLAGSLANHWLPLQIWNWAT